MITQMKSTVKNKIVKVFEFLLNVKAQQKKKCFNFQLRVKSINALQHTASRSPPEKENYWHYRNIRHTGRPHIDRKLRCTTSEEVQLYKVQEVLVADKGKSGVEDLD